MRSKPCLCAVYRVESLIYSKGRTRRQEGLGTIFKFDRFNHGRTRRQEDVSLICFLSKIRRNRIMALRGWRPTSYHGQGLQEVNLLTGEREIPEFPSASVASAFELERTIRVLECRRRRTVLPRVLNFSHILTEHNNTLTMAEAVELEREGSSRCEVLHQFSSRENAPDTQAGTRTCVIHGRRSSRSYVCPRSCRCIDCDAGNFNCHPQHLVTDCQGMCEEVSLSYGLLTALFTYPYFPVRLFVRIDRWNVSTENAAGIRYSTVAAWTISPSHL